MTDLQLTISHGDLKRAFQQYRKRYLNVGKKPDLKKFLPNDVYHTMRLEGELVSRKQIQRLFH